MNTNEIARVLAYAYSLDGRISVDEAKVVAWSRALSAHMPFDLAIEFVGKHYANSREVVMPSDLNMLFRNVRQAPQITEGFSPVVHEPADNEYRARCVADLNAKLTLDAKIPYIKGGKPWVYPMGSGGYVKALAESGQSTVTSKTTDASLSGLAGAMGLVWE